MRTEVRIFSNKQCTMIVNSLEVKSLKANRIVCLEIEVNENYEMVFFIQKEDLVEKTLKLSLTPDSACSAYIVSVDWKNENISCLKDNTDPTHRHIKMDENNKPHCFIYDAKTFSLYQGLDAPYEYWGDFNEYGLAKVRYKTDHSGFNHYKYGVIDKNCRMIIPIEYDDIVLTLDGYILATNKYPDTIYIFSTNGETILERKASFTSSLSLLKDKWREYDGLVSINDNYEGRCYINLDNEIVINLKYPGYRYDDNLCIAYDSAYHKGVTDIDGKVIISFNYEEIYPIKMLMNNEYIYIVGAERNKYFIVVNSNEQQIIDGSFEQVKFRDDIICLLRDGEWSLYDKRLRLIAKYGEEEIRIWQWISINLNGRWLPFDQAVNY